MDLRPRNRITYSGFTNTEIEKMEHLFKDGAQRSFDFEYCKKLARVFNRSKGRAGKPVLKWMEIENWFRNRQQQSHSPDNSADNPRKFLVAPETCPVENSLVPKSEKIQSRIMSVMEFEARSSIDGAWYDIKKFTGHQFLGSGEAEVLVRFIGFGPEDEEWVNVKNVRERSISLEKSECNLVKVGEYVLCFQERKDQARYFEAHVVDIEKRLHDIRGCRCLFMIQYVHDKTEERVHLSRLCFRPCILGISRKKLNIFLLRFYQLGRQV